MTALLISLTVIGLVGGWAGLHYARVEHRQRQQQHKDDALPVTDRTAAFQQHSLFVPPHHDRTDPRELAIR